MSATLPGNSSIPSEYRENWSDKPILELRSEFVQAHYEHLYAWTRRRLFEETSERNSEWSQQLMDLAACHGHALLKCAVASDYLCNAVLLSQSVPLEQYAGAEAYVVSTSGHDQIIIGFDYRGRADYIELTSFNGLLEFDPSGKVTWIRRPSP